MPQGTKFAIRCAPDPGVSGCTARHAVGARRWGDANLVGASSWGSKRAVSEGGGAERPEAGRSAARRGIPRLYPTPAGQPEPTAVPPAAAAPSALPPAARAPALGLGGARRLLSAALTRWPKRSEPSGTPRHTEPEKRKDVLICACDEHRAPGRSESMRNLMLATASAIVLGMAGTGIGQADEQTAARPMRPDRR
jgi:hypothetical protein